MKTSMCNKFRMQNLFNNKMLDVDLYPKSVKLYSDLGLKYHLKYLSLLI